MCSSLAVPATRARFGYRRLYGTPEYEVFDTPTTRPIQALQYYTGTAQTWCRPMPSLIFQESGYRGKEEAARGGASTSRLEQRQKPAAKSRTKLRHCDPLFVPVRKAGEELVYCVLRTYVLIKRAN